MSHLLLRWTLRLLVGAMVYPVMQFVVLPRLSARPQADGHQMAVWQDVSKQLTAPKPSRTAPTLSAASATHAAAQRGSTAPRARSRASTPSEKIVDVGGNQMVIAPALNLGKSVRFETGKPTSSSSASCKPGST